MSSFLASISNVVLPLTSIITIVALLIQLRRNTNINKADYLLTIDKYFAENDDMQKIYKILSDHGSCPILCNFEETTSSELSTYLTFLENFNTLISKSGIITKGELYNLFGHRIFSILHNKKMQCFEIEKYRDHYRNLFMLHEALFIYCIKNNEAIPYIQNAEYFIKGIDGNYRKGYAKHQRKIEARIDESMVLSMKKYGDKFIMDLHTPILNRIKKETYEIKGCYFRHCSLDDFSVITEIQDKAMEDLRKNQLNGLFIPTENDQIKEFLEQEDIFFICAQTPDGICAYSCTFFNNKIEYDLSYNFKNKRVATFDTVVVLSDFRGNKLHDKLLKISIEEAKKRNYEIMAATVSPDNFHSINNFIENGFKILKIKFISETKSHEEYKRYIVYKSLIDAVSIEMIPDN
jgi:ribosomal protein S18 acetylase RimI-like enzyme